MESRIELKIQCPSCGGTGLYIGLAEGPGTAVICRTCWGSGEYLYTYSYNEFKGRKELETVQRVYKKGTRYKLGLGVIDFDGIGEINMDKEGVSYQEFLDGAVPEHIEKLGCPMLADQGACHDLAGFVDACMALNGGWLSVIPECAHQYKKEACWIRFREGR